MCATERGSDRRGSGSEAVYVRRAISHLLLLVIPSPFSDSLLVIAGELSAAAVGLTDDEQKRLGLRDGNRSISRKKNS